MTGSPIPPAVGSIETVLGSISPDQLGFCLPHEHIWCDQALAPRPELFGLSRSTDTYMRLRDEPALREELAAFRAEGGRSIVEVTCDGWGRDLTVLGRLSAASGVHIIATAGFYIEPCLPAFVAEWTIPQLTAHLVTELNVGANGTPHRCGILKSAVHRARVEGLELKGLLAVAAAHRQTGVAITSHTTGGRRGEIPGGTIGVQQLAILREEGVAPDRFIVGHVDERPDLDVLSELASTGCFIQFDVIGKEHWLLDQTRAELIIALLGRGWGDNLLLSHDRNRDHEMRYGGGTGYCHLVTSFLPRLRALGMSNADITRLTVQNPARALTRTAPSEEIAA